MLRIACILFLISNFSDLIMGIGEQLGQALESVHVGLRDVEGVDTELARAKFDSFEPKLVHNKITGVNKTNLEKVGETLMMDLNLTEFFDPAFEEEIGKQVRGLFEFLPLTSERKVKLEGTPMDGLRFRSIFGLIFGINNDDGTFDIAYAIHQLQFKLAPRGFTLSCNPLEELVAIKELYPKHQALLSFKQENIIKEILYV